MSNAVTKKGDQVETSLEHPNIDLEAQEKEKKAKNKKDGKDEKDDDKGGQETYEDWDPERKAHAEKVAKACADLYQFMVDNPSIEGMLASRMTGVATGFGAPLYYFQSLGVKLPDQKMPGTRGQEKKDQSWWGGEIPPKQEEPVEKEKEAKQHVGNKN